VYNPIAFPLSTTSYSVLISDAVCQDDSTFTVQVTVHDLPNVKAGKSNDINCSLPSARLNATGAQTYVWFPATGLNDAFSANPLAVTDSTMIYTVQGTDQQGCTNEDTVTVNVAFTGQLQALLPSAFTPNGDGLNDCFGISRWGTVGELEFSIYNRWGGIVFYTKDPSKCWDGTYQSRMQPGGVFVYMIRAKTSCGNVFLKGTVTLIR
jgi:gliding motility-associated-like protein